MNTLNELVCALRILAKEEPEFMRSLIGQVIKENLTISSETVGWQGESETYVLKWKESDYDWNEFSRAY